MLNFHVMGDSHAMSHIWDFEIPGLNIICHHLGPRTCAWFGTERPEVKIASEDWICFCFGEIDCRDNVGKDKEHYKEVIDKISENYFYALKQVSAARIFVFNVVPAVIQATAAGNPWPCCGTDEERREYVRYMNECLKKGCEDNGFVFFDVHDKYAYENGFFNLEYRDHCVHIDNPIFLKEFLNENLNSYTLLQ